MPRLPLGLLMLGLTATLSAQRPILGPAARQFVAVDTTAVALTHVRVIDGTGRAATAGTLIMDLAGKSVIPGLVMVHEHLHYPTGPGVSGNLTQSFSRLYLAGGVTSMRTASNMNGIGEIKLKQAIDARSRIGRAWARRRSRRTCT